MQSIQAPCFIATIALAFLSSSCSRDSSKPAMRADGDSPPTISNLDDGVSSDSHSRADSLAADSHAERSVPATRPVNGGSEPATERVKTMLAEIEQLLSTQPEARSREELFAQIEANMNRIIALSEKIVAANPEPEQRDEARMAAMRAIPVLIEVGSKRPDLIERTDRLADEILAAKPDDDTAVLASFLRVVVHLLIDGERGMDDPAVTKRLFAMAKEFAETFPEFSRGNQLLYQIGQNAQAAGQYDTAMDALKLIADREGESEIGKIISGKVRLLKTVGKPPAIAGPTLDGAEIDIASFKGKVVLVDFWATWWEPCVAELPNVKSVYDKYHEQGFEVLAVSLDENGDDVRRFVEQKEVPWPQIYFDEDGKRKWDNPLGQKYGIDAIPATLLVDRDGNLQRIGARGAALEPAVIELLRSR
jgi:peroxiredoxin